MNNLSVTERQNGFISVLDLEGKILLGDGCKELREALRLLMRNGEKRVLLNMEKVSQIDSSGLGELVAAFVAVQKSGGELKLLNLTQRVNELMLITQLVNIFEVYESEAEAINSFHNSSKKIEPQQNPYVTGKLNQALVNF